MKEEPANLLRLILHIKSGGKVFLRGWFDEAEIAWDIFSKEQKPLIDYCSFDTARAAIEFLISQDAKNIQIVAAKTDSLMPSSGGGYNQRYY